jgi:uncharacterized phiE125 gp8 family phage protein
MTRPALVQIEAPAALPVDLPIVYQHLNLILSEAGEPEDAADAAYIEELVKAAVSRLDGPTGLLNRCLIVQTWQASFPHFPAALRFPIARVSNVVSVEYIAGDGSPKTLPPDDYITLGLNTDLASIRPAAGKRWPSTLRDHPEAVTVTFVCGFGDSPDDVPGDIRLAIMEMTATSYANREDTVVGTGAASLPSSATRVVADWTFWSGLYWNRSSNG